MQCGSLSTVKAVGRDMATQWTIKVWWCDGRVTEHTADSRAKALDVVSGDCHPFERYELAGGIVTAETQAKALCEALNARAAALQAEHGKAPLYRNFGYELGRKYARIFWSDKGGGRSALAFVDAEGVVRRADSWKKAGRLLGHRVDVVDYVGGPL